MEDTTLSLLDVSTRLGVSPSAVKKRVANLNIPVQRGARGKLIFDSRAFGLLAQADELLKAGHDFETCRRQLGLGPDPVPAAEAPVLEALIEAETPEAPTEAEVPTEAEAPMEAEAPKDVEEAPAIAPETVVRVVAEAEPPVPEAPASFEAPAAIASEPRPMGSVRTLPTPVLIQLGRRKAETAQAAPPATTDPQERELLTRLDKALKIMEEKEKQNQTLQAKLLVAYDEMTKLSATAAAFQERSLNLQLKVSELESDLRLLTAPEEQRPWWKFWD